MKAASVSRVAITGSIPSGAREHIGENRERFRKRPEPSGARRGQLDPAKTAANPMLCR
jgi:hypothetical protein